MTNVSPEQAIARARYASRYDPPFEKGWCKRKTRGLYDVPSDGTTSAAEAWLHAKRTHPVTAFSVRLQRIPRGALVWWTGGSDGKGHVAISAGDGKVWSVDIKRTGHWDLVDIVDVAVEWPALKLVGWSEDIDGVHVLNSRGKHIDRAERALEGAVLDHGQGDKADYARRLLRELRKWRLA